MSTKHKDFAVQINESIKLELYVADLYLLFKNAFQEDADFWWKLVLEEKNHAALISSGKEYFEPLDEFPHDLLASSLQKLKNVNSKLESLIRKFKKTSPSREEAFRVAVLVEESAGELHFQNFMDKESNSMIHKIFKKLNKEDRDHKKRICSYIKNIDIKIH